MKKKSQIGIFVLLGLVLVISAGFIFYLNGYNVKTAETEKTSELSLELAPLKGYIESCIDGVGRDVISLIGPHGGYFILPKYSTEEYPAKTAYYFYINRDLMPSKNEIEQELSKYMNEELFFCIRNFADFKEMGLKVEQGEIDTETAIGSDSVIFKVNFPLLISKAGNEFRLDSFTESIGNVRLGVIYNVSKEIIDEQMKDFDSICLSCIINWAIEKDLQLDLQRIDNSTILFTITDNNTIIYGIPYKFIFANRYREVSCKNIPNNWPTEKINQFLLDCVKSQIESYNYSLKINDIPDLKSIVGTQFVYNVSAVGANVNFSDYTNLFEINQTTGLINFTPNEDDTGEHIIWVSAVDSLGNQDYSSFKLDVIKDEKK